MPLVGQTLVFPIEFPLETVTHLKAGRHMAHLQCDQPTIKTERRGDGLWESYLGDYVVLK